MLNHYYRMRNADGALSTKYESLVLSVIPENQLLTEDTIYVLYANNNRIKPSEFPSLSRSSVLQHVKLLEDKGFLKAFSGFELRNSLKLPK